MSQETSLKHCLACNRSENEIPLVTLTYSTKPAYICSHCLPLLIHHPEQFNKEDWWGQRIFPLQNTMTDYIEFNVCSLYQIKRV